MKRETITRLHRILGAGMDGRVVDELTQEHLDVLALRGDSSVPRHASFLYNNLHRRFRTSPQADMGAHFLPALIVAFLGLGLYIGAGEPVPSSPPAWSLYLIAGGLIWLIAESCRAKGFPTARGLGPALAMGFGALSDAAAMSLFFPEDHLIRIGLILMGVFEPTLFIMLRNRDAKSISWPVMRNLLSTDLRLQRVWLLLATGIALIGFGDLVAVVRFELSPVVRLGYGLTGVGLFWLAQAFYVATRPPVRTLGS